jgi:hypothetical protein
MRIIANVALVLALCCEAFGQSAAPSRVFEVASIRPHPEPPHSMGMSASGNRLTVEASYLGAVVMYAYSKVGSYCLPGRHVRYRGKGSGRRRSQ